MKCRSFVSAKYTLDLVKIHLLWKYIDCAISHVKHTVSIHTHTHRIRTGWSTVSSRKVTKTFNLSSHELKHIKDVLKRAAAFEHQEEIRVG